MRSALALAVLVLVCACAADDGPLDATPTDTDTPAARDAARADAPDALDAPDAPRDAATDTDAGPPPLAAQSWALTLDFASNPTQATLRLEARGETGTVRVIASANGVSSSGLFDVVGGHLVGLSTLVIGGPFVAPCGLTRIELRRPILDFDDRDGDGLHETLRSLSILDDYVVTQANGRVTTYPASFFTTLTAGLDTIPPRFSVDADTELAPGPPLIVHASESIDPAVLFQLVGPATYTFDAPIDAAAPAHWTLETSRLPPGHYTFEVPAEARDLAGLAAADGDRPTFAFDVRDPFVHALPAVDRRVVSYTSASEISLLPADATHGESIFSASRLVAAVDLAPGTYTLSSEVRVAGPDAAHVFGALRIHAPDGSRTDFIGSHCGVASGSTLPGYTAECTLPLGALDFVATVAGRYFVVVDGGDLPLGCSTFHTSPTSAIALESLHITP